MSESKATAYLRTYGDTVQRALENEIMSASEDEARMVKVAADPTSGPTGTRAAEIMAKSHAARRIDADAALVALDKLAQALALHGDIDG
jgi:hypothetical protein